MALPDNIKTQAELRQCFQHYVDNSSFLDVFVLGSLKQLDEGLKGIGENQVLLFCPYPSMIPRDRSGALDFRFTCQIGVFTPKTKNDSEVDSNMDKVGSAIRKLLVRLREDNRDKAWTFTINDINQIDPVVDGEFVGYQYPLYLGDFEPPIPDTADWNDLP